VRRSRAEQGQGSVELVAVAPVLLLVGLALAQGLLSVRAQLSGERALARARVAWVQGADPVAAARAGLPRGSLVSQRGASIDVHVRLFGPRVPGMPDEVVAHARLES
jgi:hypothetical protein